MGIEPTSEAWEVNFEARKRTSFGIFAFFDRKRSEHSAFEPPKQGTTASAKLIRRTLLLLQIFAVIHAHARRESVRKTQLDWQRTTLRALCQPTNLLSGTELEKSVAIVHGFSSSVCK